MATVSKRQVRELQGGTSAFAENFRKSRGFKYVPFSPIYSKPHPSGMNRHARRGYFARGRGKGEVGERARTRRCGIAFCQQLERLIRSGAPYNVVRAFKLGIPVAMSKRLVTKQRAKHAISASTADDSLARSKMAVASMEALSRKETKKPLIERLGSIFRRKTSAG